MPPSDSSDDHESYGNRRIEVHTIGVTPTREKNKAFSQENDSPIVDAFESSSDENGASYSSAEATHVRRVSV